jgi:hypothetical protein
MWDRGIQLCEERTIKYDGYVVGEKNKTETIFSRFNVFSIPNYGIMCMYKIVPDCSLRTINQNGLLKQLSGTSKETSDQRLCKYSIQLHFFFLGAIYCPFIGQKKKFQSLVISTH